MTSEHHRSGLKRDTASVWVEDITTSSFKVCLRELQNYDGPHEDIYVVSGRISAIKDCPFLAKSSENAIMCSFSFITVDFIVPKCVADAFWVVCLSDGDQLETVVVL